MTMQAMIDEWYPVGLFSQLDSEGRKTALMGEPIKVARDADGNARVTGGDGRVLPVARALRSCLVLPRRAEEGTFPHSRGRPARPPLRRCRRGARALLAAARRREFPRHRPFPLRPYRYSRRRAAYRGPELQGRDPRGRRRGLGDAGEILPAAGRQVGKRRDHDGIYVSRAGARPARCFTRPARRARANGMSSRSSSSRSPRTSATSGHGWRSSTTRPR